MQQITKEGCKSLAAFHDMFPVREEYAKWHLDTKSNQDIIREEDIQILRDWRSLVGNAPGEGKRTDYGFGLEDIEGHKSERGLPGWCYSSMGQNKAIAMEVIAVDNEIARNRKTRKITARTMDLAANNQGRM